MDPERRRLLKVLGAAGLGGLAGCTGGPTESTPTEEPTDTPTPTEASGGGDGGMESTPTETSDGMEETPTATATGTPMDPTYVGMVYATGGLGDGSFNDQAQQGLFAAEEDFSVQYQESQPETTSEFSTFSASSPSRRTRTTIWSAVSGSSRPTP